MEEKTICSVCGAKLTDETAIEFDGKVFCRKSLERAFEVFTQNRGNNEPLGKSLWNFYNCEGYV